MQTIKFNSNGGPIIVNVSAGQAQTGSYILKLWEADVNQIVMREEGNFVNPNNDSYALPNPTSSNKGRLIDSTVTVGIIPGNDYYQIDLDFYQDGEKIGNEMRSGSSEESTVTHKMYVLLDT